MTWTTTITGEAINLRHSATLDIETHDGKYCVYSIGTIDSCNRRIDEFDTHEEAEEFIKNLVAQLNERSLQ